MPQTAVVLAVLVAVTVWALAVGGMTVTDAALPTAPRYIGGVALIVAGVTLAAATVALAHAELS